MSTQTVSIDDLPLSKFHIRMTIFTTGGFFIDGYILGIVGIALAVWSPQVGLSSLWDGLIGASALIGIFVGSLVFGPIIDRVGRQLMYIADLLVFIIASAIQLFVEEPWQLFVLRLIMGVAIGIDYAIGPALLSEMLPKRYRGTLLACLNATYTVGFVVAFVTGYALRGWLGEESWRWMLVSGAVPALIILLLRLGSPESPRWLATHGQTEKATAVLRKHFGENVSLGELHTNVEKTGIGVLFSRRWRRRTIFASVFWMCQVMPYFALFTLLPQVLSSLGVSDEFTGGLALNGFQLLGGIVGVIIMNMIPRRAFVIWSFGVLAICIGLLGIVPNPSSVLVIVSFAVFSFVVSAAGNLESVYPAELFPTEIRATGVGFAAAMSRIGAAIGTFLLPVSMSSLGTSPTMLIGAAVLVVGLVVSMMLAPDTRDLSLTEASGNGSTLGSSMPKSVR